MVFYPATHIIYLVCKFRKKSMQKLVIEARTKGEWLTANVFNHPTVVFILEKEPFHLGWPNKMGAAFPTIWGRGW